ncbi:MAG: cation transporter [Candidatus Thiothrix moscowensis]|nr:cation transporter [Candidatus Thiothrix moscowensis]
METRIQVENIRCGGCANTISKKLLENEQIKTVNVDIENQTITLESEADVRETAVGILFGLGYPERGSVEGLESLKEKARSVVSCAIGRIDMHTKG